MGNSGLQNDGGRAHVSVNITLLVCGQVKAWLVGGTQTALCR